MTLLQRIKTPFSEPPAEEPVPARPRFRTVGEVLRERRSQLGYDLDQIGADLRIKPAYLAAIEQSRSQDLPGTAYALGFVRAYANHLGLDPDKVIDRFRLESKDLQAPQDLSLPVALGERSLPGAAMLLVALILALCGYGTWYYLATGERSRPERVAAVPATLRGAPAGPAAGPQAAPPPAEPAPLPAPAGAAASGPTLASGLVPPPSPAEPPSSAPSAASGANSASATAPSASTPATTGQASGTLMAPAAAASAAPPRPPLIPPAASASGNTGPAGATAANSGPATPAGKERASVVAAAGSQPPPAAAPSASTPVSASATSTASPDSGAATTSATQAGGGRVAIKALADCWIQVRGPDQTVVFSRVLKRGEVYPVPARSGLYLRTGNAGALEISVDGKAAPSIGGVGAMRRNVTLEPDALIGGTAVQG